VVGDLDMMTCPALLDRVKAALPGSTCLILDLSELTFCDSSGLRALINLFHETRAQTIRYVLAAPDPRVRCPC
jgi:anti-sigma B factor antagonist